MSVGFGSVLLVAGGAVGGYIAAKLLENNERGNTTNRNDFEKLVAKQTVCDELDGPILAEWFRKNESRGGDDPVFFIARPNEYTSRIFALDQVPANIDADHNLLQVVVNKKSFQVKAIRLVSFTSLADGVAKLLGDKDYIIVKGD